MLRVTIDIWPLGDESRKRTLGIIDIANDGTGTLERGNYMVRLGHRSDPAARTWRSGAVAGFPRASLGIYDLLLRALVNLVGGRNRAAVKAIDPELAEVPAATHDI